ncbi:hypothetical protein NL676_009439 [Syzygium grande]|nr:hypothetical protein NL676_009439 [Syzygium grande]
MEASTSEARAEAKGRVEARVMSQHRGDGPRSWAMTNLACMFKLVFFLVFSPHVKRDEALEGAHGNHDENKDFKKGKNQARAQEARSEARTFKLVFFLVFSPHVKRDEALEGAHGLISQVTMMRIKTLKNGRIRRELKKRALKLVEIGKKTLILQGMKTSGLLNIVLIKIYHPKKESSVRYTRRNDNVRQFKSGGETSLEFFSQKTDYGMFVVSLDSSARGNHDEDKDSKDGKHQAIAQEARSIMGGPRHDRIGPLGRVPNQVRSSSSSSLSSPLMLNVMKRLKELTVTMMRIKTSKKGRIRRELKKRALKLVEIGKKTLILQGMKTSGLLNIVLIKIYHLKKESSVRYTRRNDNVRRFKSGGETSLEFFSQKTDYGMFVVRSSSSSSLSSPLMLNVTKRLKELTVTMMRIKTLKNGRIRRELKKHALKLVEIGKKTLILQGMKTSGLPNIVLIKIYHPKKESSVRYTRRNDNVRQFKSGGETSLEFFSQKTDYGMFVVRSSSSSSLSSPLMLNVTKRLKELTVSFRK